MPVFFKGRRRILFIHVPKAGGTSIEVFFEANGFKTFYLDRGESSESLNEVRRCSPQHMHAALLGELFDTAAFDYAFMMVRHPERRLLSKFAMEYGETECVEQLEEWILRAFSVVFTNPYFLDNHLRPQSDFLIPEARVFKLEDGLEEPFVARLEAESGFTFSNRVVRREMHAGFRTPKLEMVRPGIRELIRNYYARDFGNFGYI